jgi:hypothetical protein
MQTDANANTEGHAISWKTVSDYLAGSNEVPIPLSQGLECILLVKPGVGAELQLRTPAAHLTPDDALPELVRLKYERKRTATYSFLAVVCELSDFNETTLNFFRSIGHFFVEEGLTAHTAIRSAYQEWKHFLEMPPSIPESTLLGLWGELYVLSEAISSNPLGASTIIHSWTGPLQAANDFSFGNCCIEVKTTIQAGSKIVLSSINQLDAPEPWIVIVRARHLPPEHSGVSLGTLYKTISAYLSPADSLTFSNKVERIVPIATLDAYEHFALVACDDPFVVQVDNSVPVLTRSKLSSLFDAKALGKLCDLSYSIDLSGYGSTPEYTVAKLFNKVLRKGSDE